MTERVLNREMYRPLPRERVTVLVGECRGGRSILEDGNAIATDTDDQVAAMARLISQIPKGTRSIAWIGGGLCVGPEILRSSHTKQTVYELRPYFAEFCPESVAFIPGDWQNTLTGTYDIIIWDLDDDPPRARLARHLTKDGKVLPPLALEPAKGDVIDGRV